MRTLSLNKYLTKLVLLSVLPLILLAGILAHYYVQTLRNQLEREALDRTGAVAAAVDGQLRAQISALQMLADSPFLDDSPRWKEFYREAKSYQERLGGHVILADRASQMILNTRSPLGTVLPKLPVPRGNAAVPLVLATRKPAVGDLFFGPVAHEPLTAIVVPVLRDNQIIYFLLNTLAARQFQPGLNKAALPQGWSLTLLDGKGEVIARRWPQGRSNASGLQEGPGRFRVRSAHSHWSVVLDVPPGIYRNSFLVVALGIGGAILVMTLISFLGGKTAGRQLTRSMETLARKGSPPVDVPIISEIEKIRRLLSEASAARRAAESERRESEEKYRLLAENASDVIWILDLDRGRFRYVSPAVENLRGYTADEVLDQDMSATLTPESFHYLLSVTPERMERFRQGSIEFYTDEIDQPHKNGTIVRTEVTSRFISNKKTNSLEVVGITRDVTGRKEAEENLRRSEVKFRSYIESSPVAVLVADKNGQILDFNSAVVTLLDYTAADLRRLTIFDLHPEEDLEKVRRAFAGLNQERPIQGDYRLKKKDGKILWTSLNVVVIGDQISLGYIQDISERKKAEESLKNSLAEKIALLKEVHHRVKNNLQIIASLLSLQAGHTTSREVADILSDTRSRVRSMALLHEMLYQSGTLASINFKAYGKELCTQLLRSCSPAGARITVEVKMAPLALGLEQAVPCGLILSELVSNALKHGFSHKRTGTIEVSLEKEDQMLFLSVKDDGEGLPIDFDPAQTGTLGLKLVSNLAAQLGGRLNIKGPEVKGSVFEVIFPG